MRVFFYQAQARRDDATLGLPAAFPSLGVAPPRGVYDATVAAPGFGNAGPALPIQADTPCHWQSNFKEGKLAGVSRSSLGNGRLPPRRKRKKRGLLVPFGRRPRGAG